MSLLVSSPPRKPRATASAQRVAGSTRRGARSRSRPIPAPAPSRRARRRGPGAAARMRIGRPKHRAPEMRRLLDHADQRPDEAPADPQRPKSTSCARKPGRRRSAPAGCCCPRQRLRAHRRERPAPPAPPRHRPRPAAYRDSRRAALPLPKDGNACRHWRWSPRRRAAASSISSRSRSPPDPGQGKAAVEAAAVGAADEQGRGSCSPRWVRASKPRSTTA